MSQLNFFKTSWARQDKERNQAASQGKVRGGKSGQGTKSQGKVLGGKVAHGKRQGKVVPGKKTSRLLDKV